MGQRVQILTPQGSVWINTRWEINTTNGVAVLTKITGQELSGSVSTDFLDPRDETDPTTNGHFTVTATS